MTPNAHVVDEGLLGLMTVSLAAVGATRGHFPGSDETNIQWTAWCCVLQWIAGQSPTINISHRLCAW